ncbi:putative aminoacyl-tRNA deacylase [Gordonia effusa NBRC 100432]|uniref:Cys-tRNA(Pro)/Cys-tRNA(Cys) deacylase n=1 Tax=Gordonia effusa NBRC 100432 TaxID=1077974 RepID=H0QUW8_9ACTN|nr:aminoacyl-tRNA deacylase [Gordonia effusa]GAB16619.1 putative aminoacyl-tRNA deacylase [Gordonia effusa NBRC 100432]
MAATPAIAALEKSGIAHQVHKYRHDARSTDYGAEAVDALGPTLGIVAAQIFKTLVVDLSGSLAVAIIPVPQQLSLKSTAAALGSAKAVMADPKAVTRSTGYVLGGVSPLGQRTRLATVIDSSAQTWPTILCSAGRRGLEIALDPVDLIAATGAIIADIAV